MTLLSLLQFLVLYIKQFNVAIIMSQKWGYGLVNASIANDKFQAQCRYGHISHAQLTSIHSQDQFKAVNY